MVSSLVGVEGGETEASPKRGEVAGGQDQEGEARAREGGVKLDILAN